MELIFYFYLKVLLVSLVKFFLHWGPFITPPYFGKRKYNLGSGIGRHQVWVLGGVDRTRYLLAGRFYLQWDGFAFWLHNVLVKQPGFAGFAWICFSLLGTIENLRYFQQRGLSGDMSQQRERHGYIERHYSPEGESWNHHLYWRVIEFLILNLLYFWLQVEGLLWPWETGGRLQVGLCKPCKYVLLQMADLHRPALFCNILYAENYVKPGTDGLVHTNRIEVNINWNFAVVSSLCEWVVCTRCMSSSRGAGAVWRGSFPPVVATSWSLICPCKLFVYLFCIINFMYIIIS